MSMKKRLFAVFLSFPVVTSYAQNNDGIINIESPTQTVVFENSEEQEEIVTSKIASALDKARLDEKTKNKILTASMSYKKAVIAFKEGNLKNQKNIFLRLWINFQKQI